MENNIYTEIWGETSTQEKRAIVERHKAIDKYNKMAMLKGDSTTIEKQGDLIAIDGVY